MTNQVPLYRKIYKTYKSTPKPTKQQSYYKNFKVTAQERKKKRKHCIRRRIKCRRIRRWKKNPFCMKFWKKIIITIIHTN